MKLSMVLLVLICSYFSTSFASLDKSPLQEYKFSYHINKKVFIFTEKASSYEQALEKVSLSCFKKFNGDKETSVEQGMDLVDLCVNPRKS